ncbi:flagellar protein G [Halovenus rubra]|uniref:Flagellar protein G n=2 Tax=Halovenus rubra TaxID=869890 RepID=A0ACC7E140_9EURY|nr:flagellar protein G [Halovenus rubra]
MASVSVSHLILFIASMIIAAGVAGVFTTSVEDLSNAIDERGVQISDNVRTSVDIISDSGSSNIYDGTSNTTTIYVKNTGSQSLNPVVRQIDILVNGSFKTSDDVSATVLSEGNPDTWDTNEVIELQINDHLSTGDHRILVIVNGDEETFKFRVEDNT